MSQIIGGAAANTFQGGTSAAGRRLLWIDLARGFGIVLVVFGHALRGVVSAFDLQSDPVFLIVDEAIYLFHMPLFFFLSGQFFERGVLRDGQVSSLRKRIVTLIYPLIIWSYVLAAMRFAAGGETNRGAPDLFELLLYPFPPKDIFWFLWALFVMQTLLALVVPLAKRHHSIFWLLTAVFLPISVWGSTLPDELLWRPILINAVFFILGIASAPSMPPLLARSHAGWVGIALIAACEVAFFALLQSDAQLVLKPLLSAGCVIGAVFICGALTRFGGSIVQAAGTLGLASMAIYVMHVPVSAALRILLLKLGMDDILLHLAYGTLAGVTVPLIFYLLVRRWKLTRLFGLG